MTSREMLYGLRLQLDLLFDNSIKYISDVDLLYYLNKSQEKLIKDKLIFFEQNQIITDELRTLLVEPEPLSPIKDKDKFITILPSDYKILAKHKCRSNSSCGSKMVPGILVRADSIYIHLKNPFRKPTPEEPLYYLLGNTIVYEDPEGVLDIKETDITYIKQQEDIQVSGVNSQEDVSSELPEFVHEEIIDLAKALVIEDKQLNLNN